MIWVSPSKQAAESNTKVFLRQLKLRTRIQSHPYGAYRLGRDALFIVERLAYRPDPSGCFFVCILPLYAVYSRFITAHMRAAARASAQSLGFGASTRLRCRLHHFLHLLFCCAAIPRYGLFYLERGCTPRYLGLPVVQPTWRHHVHVRRSSLSHFD